MARRGRPSGRFFIYSALTALAVVLAKDAVDKRGGTAVAMPGRATSRRVP
jgi:hypothetical protein